MAPVRTALTSNTVQLPMRKIWTNNLRTRDRNIKHIMVKMKAPTSATDTESMSSIHAAYKVVRGNSAM